MKNQNWGYYIGPIWVLLASLRNPWFSQPLVGDELPHLKGVITTTYYTSCYHPLEPQVVKERKTNKREKENEEGWKNKGRGNSCTEISPSYIHTSKVWASLITTTLLYHVMWLGASLFPPTWFYNYFTWHLPFDGCTMSPSLTAPT